MKMFFFTPIGIFNIKKKLLLMLFLCYFTLSGVGQCPYSKTVGSDVGIPNITVAISQGILPVTMQVPIGLSFIKENFCIKGSFDASNSYTLKECFIKVLPNSKLVYSSNQQNFITKCEITGDVGSSEILVQGPSTWGVGLDVSNSIFKYFNKFTVDKASLLNWDTKFEEINGVFITDGSIYNNFHTRFYNAKLDLLNAAIFSFDSWYEINYAAPIFIATINLKNSHFYGFNDDYYGNWRAIFCNPCNTFKSNGSRFINNNYSITIYKPSTNIEINSNTFKRTDINVSQPWTRAIYCFNTDDVKILNNSIELNPNGGDNYSLELRGGNNYTIKNNPALTGLNLFNDIISSEISQNPKMGPIDMRKTTDVKLLYNNIRSGGFYSFGLFSLTNNSLNFSHNHVLSPSTEVNTVKGGDYNTFKCNTFENGKIGMSFDNVVSNNALIDLDIVDNHFVNNSTGIYFDNMKFPAQIDKGNDFFSNSLIGVKGNMINTADSYFRVRNGTEFPTHEPSNIMITPGALNPPVFCSEHPGNLVDTSGTYAILSPSTEKCYDDNLNFKISLIKTYFSCYQIGQQISAKCHTNIKKALEMIKRCPNILEDVEINALYDTINYTDVAKLPEFIDVRKNVYVKYYTTDYFPSFTNGVPNAVQIQELNEVIALKNQNDIISDSLKKSKILNEFNLINALKLSEPTAIAYKSALLWFLDYEKNILLTPTRQSEIISLAENCNEEGSPGNEVARFLCNAYQLDYNPGLCTTIRSKLEVLDTKITPNPTSNILIISNGAFDKQSLILDALGKIVYDWVLIDNKSIDVSNLPAGIYFLRLNNQNNVLKFIKI